MAKKFYESNENVVFICTANSTHLLNILQQNFILMSTFLTATDI